MKSKGMNIENREDYERKFTRNMVDIQARGKQWGHIGFGNEKEQREIKSHKTINTCGNRGWGSQGLKRR